MAFLKDTLIVVFYITANSWCRTNPGKTYLPYTRVSGHKSEASIKSYARRLSSSTKHAISDTFSRATEVLVANNASIPKKTTQNNHAAMPKVFSPKHVSRREQQFHSSFAIVNDPWKIILK